MSDSLTSRVGRLLSGSLASIVDALEGMAPDRVMEEALREVDRAIDDVRSELGRVLAAKHLASLRLAEENTKHDALSDKARLAVEQEREDLAEAAVARLLDIEAQIPVLESAIAGNREDEAELERYIAALQARKREMMVELDQFRASQRSRERAGAREDGSLSAVPDRADTALRKAESAFDRVMRTASTPGSMSASDRDNAVKLAELDQLAHENRIKERLAALKASSAKD
jgi:phage shock protein A